ncbi:peptidyl-tRNA hydrolase PTH2-domain-containing protein [Kockovaella imperatae]|uniref:peptidyl-tRNA hydrolase n=1 Tax=Kockovaella imperatae TaxID=4999 RepID=A0A1Y1UN33_9TREE|nr:peptidyl-tRNA hydrolase PTH2-domain-containing protein [Kockovaella imperatae]ORX39412.1 peptidyl-tRNA hydrolase PTH2-domain-containing protein [Kockovaella imperatae]
MSWLRDSRIEGLIQPLAISIIAFTIGYQLRPYLSPSSSSQTRSLSSSAHRSKKKKDQKGFEVVDGRPVEPSSSQPSAPRFDRSSSSDSEGATDAESDAEDETAAKSSDIASVKAAMSEEVKLVLVVNDSLKMSKGKIAAQAGHATLACAFMVKEMNPRLFRNWQMHGQPKIAVRCQDTEELEVLAAQARSLNLCARTIQDAGRTQVAPGSKTVLGIGPGPAKLINQVTGKLRLL